MPVRNRKPNEIAKQIMPLLLLGIGLIASSRYFTFVDDEVLSLKAASQPVQAMFAQALSVGGQHEIPPLYGALLHGWLHWTAWNFEYLRVPAIAFFLAGLFLLGRAARRLGGAEGGRATIWLGVLWPFGFHYGRLVDPNAFTFFLVAGLTSAYLWFLEEQDFARSAVLFLFGAALLWTNIFGGAVLACLVVDQLLRYRAGNRAVSVRVMARTVILWMVAFVPVSRSWYKEFITTVNVHHGFKAVMTSCALHVFNLFVSESVAPWHWQLSVPAALAVLVCIALVFINESGPSRRFLVYGCVLVILMAVTGTLLTSRLLFVSPWLLLPIAVAVGSIKSRWARPGLALTLLIIGGIGWYGIYSRKYYSAPEFLETWAQVAGDEAGKVQGGVPVISNSQPFFFYLTYALRNPVAGTNTEFEGLLPDSVRRPNVTTAEQWLSAGHPMLPTMVWIRGTADPQAEGPMNDAAQELDHSCGSRESRLMMRDQGYAWKQRFLPDAVGPQWRIEVREYDCASSNSKEIFQIPAR